jgi:hypothetical protein
MHSGLAINNDSQKVLKLFKSRFFLPFFTNSLFFTNDWFGYLRIIYSGALLLCIQDMLHCIDGDKTSLHQG